MIFYENNTIETENSKCNGSNWNDISVRKIITNIVPEDWHINIKVTKTDITKGISIFF